VEQAKSFIHEVLDDDDDDDDDEIKQSY